MIIRTWRGEASTEEAAGTYRRLPFQKKDVGGNHCPCYELLG